MVSARKRSIREVDGDDGPQLPKEPSLLHRIRSTWQFANVSQFLAIFGPALKMEAPDMDDLETECLKPYSVALQEIGLGLLKFLSSHRGLTLDLFDEYTRRQFTSKAPELDNPFGNEEVALKFSEFDVFKKLHVLHQMIMLIMRHPEKIRERYGELKDVDHDNTSWRIEPLGWDEDDRSYFLLDDNRLYRLTEAQPPPPPMPKPKKNSKKAKAMARAEKRRRISEAVESAAENDAQPDDEPTEPVAEEDNGLGGAKWECIATNLPEVRSFLATLQKTRDPNEKVLRDRVLEHLVPILEREEDRRLKKEKEREREMLNLARMANAKRSSRLAGKFERQRQEESAQVEEQKRLLEVAAAKKEQESLRKQEKERNSRLMSREKRLREREARRQQHEEELAHLSEDTRSVASGGAPGRLSGRRLQLQIEKNKQALRDLEDEEDDWVFDCVCGLHGQVDDGEHSVACERCNVWQHSKCLGIDKNEAESEDFHFICDPCRKRQDDQQRMRPRTTIKLKVGSSARRPPSAASRESSAAASTSGAPSKGGSSIVIQIPAQPMSSSPAAAKDTPETAKANAKASNSSPVLPPPAEQPSFMIPIKSAAPVSSAPRSSVTVLPKPATNGVHNPFSSPHPGLSPPQQSPNKSRAYDTMYDQSSPPAGGASRNGTAPTTNGRVKISTTPILPPVPPGRGGQSHGHSPTKPLAGSATKSNAMATSPGLAPVEYMQQKSSPLPSSSRGVSPTKHSPSLPPSTAGNGFHPSSSPTQLVLPPVTALNPSPRMQDPTPPVKPVSAAQPAPIPTPSKGTA